jgi:SPP1 gp7 family putative phage head morphogenesis protein
VASVNDRLFDRAISHQIHITRLGSGAASRMVALMNRLDDRLRRAMLEIDPTDATGRRQLRRLERLLERIGEINAETRRQMGGALRGELVDLAKHEVDFQDRLVRDVIGLSIVPDKRDKLSFGLPTSNQIRAAALSRPFQSVHLRWATTSQHIAEQYRRRGNVLRDEIRAAVVQGDSITTLVRRIIGTRAQNFGDGILAISRREATTIARTAVNHTANAAREAYYDQNAELIKKVRWLSVLDGRTSAICRARDGETYDVGQGPRPPAHPNCRSTTVAVFKSFRDLGLDVDDAPGLDGKNPKAISYNDWLRTQPKAFVEDVLGKEKAKVYLDGNLHLNKFVDKAGAEYTIKELKEVEPAAFERAGL